MRPCGLDQGAGDLRDASPDERVDALEEEPLANQARVPEGQGPDVLDEPGGRLGERRYVDDRAARRRGVERHLEDQRGLARAGRTEHEEQASLEEAAAEHDIQAGDAGIEEFRRVARHVHVSTLRRLAMTDAAPGAFLFARARACTGGKGPAQPRGRAVSRSARLRHGGVRICTKEVSRISRAVKHPG